MHRNRAAVVMHHRCRVHARCADGDAGERRSGHDEHDDGRKDCSPAVTPVSADPATPSMMDAHDSSKAIPLAAAAARLGAATDAARLQAVFRAHGIRRGPHAKHRTARSGWDSLTPTETTVAKLVEEGMSNPEIAAKLLLSRRTVATHVSHILKKLRVHSRTDIAREAARDCPIFEGPTRRHVRRRR
jgi:DNA-binding CsgD family transcriptional regulator